MRGTPKEVLVPNLKVYGAALVLALVLVALALFTLGIPGTPRLSDNPVSFDATRAARDMRFIATQFPQRIAGTDADNRAGLWLYEQFNQLGLETHVAGFPATIQGKEVVLQNVWGVIRGEGQGTIVVMAHRDTPVLATQGANDNASGVAALLELTRSSAATIPQKTIIFLSTTGDASGGLGARHFLKEYGDPSDVVAVIALREVATRGATGIEIDGWSTASKTAPPWLWLLPAPAARVHANEKALLPGIVAQIVHLAVPTNPGSHAPFVAAGIPGITLSAAGPGETRQNDILDNVSGETLGKVGMTAGSVLLSVDSASPQDGGSGRSVFLTNQRTLPGGSLTLMFAALLLPLAAVTVDLFAHCRRERVRLRSAFVRAGLHLTPWLIVLVLVYLANISGLLPQYPGAVPPDSPIVDEPRYIRVVILLAVLSLAYVYAAAVERRVERLVTTDPRATIFVAHATLLAIGLATLLVNPYSVVLILPAALLWPLARPGSWARSIVPSYLGLIMIPIVLIYLAVRLDVGWKVWWYFLLLVETRSMPTLIVLLAVAFVSTAGMLAHTLHERGGMTGDLDWQRAAWGRQRGVRGALEGATGSGGSDSSSGPASGVEIRDKRKKSLLRR
jgi:hypothetical protein